MNKEELEKLIKEYNLLTSVEEIIEMTKKMQKENEMITEEDVLYAFILAQEENNNQKPTLEQVLESHEELSDLESLTNLENFDFSYLDNMEKVAKKLGFSSKAEMFLYEDVCSGRIPKEPKTIEVDSSLTYQNFDINHLFSKEDLALIIREENLQELLEKVKDLSIKDRLHEIFLWNSNKWVTQDALIKIFMEKSKEAREIFDYEKAEEYDEKIAELEKDQLSFYRAYHYLRHRSKDLSRNEREEFRSNVEEVQNNIFPPKGI